MSDRWSGLALLLAVVAVAPESSADGAAEKIPLRVGFHIDRRTVDREFAERDITVATRMVFTKMLENNSEFSPTFHIYRKESEYIDAIVKGELDYVEIGPLLWMRLPEATRKSIRPLSVIQLGEQRLERLVLLAAPGETLETLAGKRLRIHSGPDRGIARLWIDHELRGGGFGSLKRHFGKVEVHHQSDSILLPTFFGKADACIVREEDYQVASELNPQIARRLAPVRTSREFPFVMTAAAGPRVEVVSEHLGGGQPGEIIKRAGGQQAFALLRIKDLRPLDEGDLDALQQLVDAAEKASRLTSTVKPEDKK